MFDFSLLRAAKGMFVLEIDGWENSFGVKAEIDLCQQLAIPVRYLDPNDLETGRSIASILRSEPRNRKTPTNRLPVYVEVLKLAPHFNGITEKVSVPKIKMISSVQHVALFKNRDFLYEKYVEKGWSASQIAEEIGSVHNTVIRNLKGLGIPLREGQKPLQRRPGLGLSYGKKVIGRQVQVHKAEAESIDRMGELRGQGFSYWKIADIFNSIGVPTKTRRAKWQAATVMKILKARHADIASSGGVGCSP